MRPDSPPDPTAETLEEFSEAVCVSPVKVLSVAGPRRKLSNVPQLRAGGGAKAEEEATKQQDKYRPRFKLAHYRLRKERGWPCTSPSP